MIPESMSKPTVFQTMVPLVLNPCARQCCTMCDGNLRSVEPQVCMSSDEEAPMGITNTSGGNVGMTTINHPLGNGLYQLSMVMTGGGSIIVIPA